MNYKYIIATNIFMCIMTNIRHKVWEKNISYIYTIFNKNVLR